MKLNSYIEHTLLKPDTTTAQIKELCAEAVQYDFAGVCVPPYFVRTAAAALENKAVKVVTVVGFPMGYSAIPTKVEEAKRAFDDGADEIDMVVNVAAVKDGAWAHVRNDIDSVTTAARLKGKVIKVIFETGLLKTGEIVKLCNICKDVGVDFVKTSTGVNAGGATVDIVEFLKQNAGGLKIKASGGVRDASTAIAMIEAGAVRVGTSSGIKIVTE